MIKAFCILTLALFTVVYSFAQVGIGTTTPNPKAVLDIKSTNKGVLLPTMTSAQRDAIVSPPDGLHVFNKSEGCLNVYDSAFASWDCYCEFDTCKVIFVRLTGNTSTDFSTYTTLYPTVRKFVVLIEQGATTATINFSSTLISSFNVYTIKIINRGNIVGAGGSGGRGFSFTSNQCTLPAQRGASGRPAIITRPGIRLFIENYGLIAGGGGGGGGGDGVGFGEYGGGGGGGANVGFGGFGGGLTFTSTSGCELATPIAQSGANGTFSTGGIGGLGTSGGGNGGNGGNLAQAGQPGSGSFGGILGGSAGKAVSSSTGTATGTIITNIAGGQVLGVVE